VVAERASGRLTAVNRALAGSAGTVLAHIFHQVLARGPSNPCLVPRSSVMARAKKSKTHLPNTGNEPIPPGATREAADRPRNPGGGAPGSGGGPRHAAADPGSPDESYEATDSNQPLAEAPLADEPDPLAEG